MLIYLVYTFNYIGFIPAHTHKLPNTHHTHTEKVTDIAQGIAKHTPYYFVKWDLILLVIADKEIIIRQERIDDDDDIGARSPVMKTKRKNTTNLRK